MENSKNCWTPYVIVLKISRLNICMSLRTTCLQPCPMWAAWGAWSFCSTSCGRGVRSHSRDCTIDGACPGVAEEQEVCFEGVRFFRILVIFLNIKKCFGGINCFNPFPTKKMNSFTNYKLVMIHPYCVSIGLFFPE